MKVERRYTKLKVPHEGKEIGFIYPSFKGKYGYVAEQIDKAGLKRPTSPEIVSLVYDAWKNPEGEYESEIIEILKKSWLWEFTGNLYLPKSRDEVNNGVILEYNPQIVNGKLQMDKNSLVERLRKNDSNVKFVPFGYKIGEQTLLKFLKNPHIIARYGKEGAEKISEIASKYRKRNYIFSFNSVDEEKTRMSALSSLRGLKDSLVVDGDYWDSSDSDGRTFGVNIKGQSSFFS